MFLGILGFPIAYKLERNKLPNPRNTPATVKKGKNIAPGKYSGLEKKRITYLENRTRKIAVGSIMNKAYLNTNLIKYFLFVFLSLSTPKPEIIGNKALESTLGIIGMKKEIVPAIAKNPVVSTVFRNVKIIY